MSSVRRVAIVGGGIAGLTTAKALLESAKGLSKSISITIFESKNNIGGMWNPDIGRCWGSMKPNLSKFTCGFSDRPPHISTPTFPCQQDVYKYVEEYAQINLLRSSLKSIPFTLRLGCSVVNLQQTNSEFSLSFIENSLLIDEIFDQVVIASGFFSIPSSPAISSASSNINIYHSNEYKSPLQFKGRKVAVVGSSFSSAEISSDIAMYTDQVFNIIPHHTWCLTRQIPSEPTSKSTPFIPIDLKFYKRKYDGMHIEEIFKSTESNRQLTEYMRSIVGLKGDVMKSFRSDYLEEDIDSTFPSFVSISDHFLHLVRAKRIKLIHGKVSSISNNKIFIDSTSSSDPQHQHQIELEDIQDIIFCTGYKPNLSYLSQDIQNAIEYDPNETFCPMILYKDILHPEIPGLYFVGMYRGLYFAVAEMQARVVSDLILNRIDTPTSAELLEGLALSREIRAMRPRRQFPHPDYIGLLDSYASLVDSLPSPKHLRKGSLVLPSQYYRKSADMTTDADLEQSSATAESAEEAALAYLRECESGRGVAECIHRALVGRWKFRRSLNSFLEGAPSGNVQGIIMFSPFLSAVDPPHSLQDASCSLSCDSTTGGSTADGKSAACTLPSNPPSQTSTSVIEDFLWRQEWIYAEQGVFQSDRGLKFDISSSYIYTYNPKKDTLDIYFPSSSTTPSETTRAHLFLSLKFQREINGWVAEGYHLCGQDHYHARFRFAFDGLCIDEIEIKFQVEGPTKNYISSTFLYFDDSSN